LSDKPVYEKLLMKPGRTVRFIHAPIEYAAILGGLPAGVTVVEEASQAADVVQLFVANRVELEAQLPGVKVLLRPGDILWVTYLKGSAKTKTDINRDTINAYAHTLGLEGVAMISVSDDWSALRLKPI
jgi:hypothetical protein